MKTRSNIYALLLLVGSLAVSSALDALFEAFRLRAADPSQISPRLWWQLGLSTVFVLLVIFMLWFVLIRYVPGRPVFIVYLLSGLLLALYVPAVFNGIDIPFGLVPREVHMFLAYYGLNSFRFLNLILLAAIGAIGLIRGRRIG